MEQSGKTFQSRNRLPCQPRLSRLRKFENGKVAKPLWFPVLRVLLHCRTAHQSLTPIISNTTAKAPRNTACGNRADNKTLQGLLRTLRRRFGITEATFVFDGGMSSKFNLEAMSQAHLKYVTRLSSATLQSVLEELPQDVQMQLGDRQRPPAMT